MQFTRIAIWVAAAVTLASVARCEEAADSKHNSDPRVERLTYFLAANRCPVKHLAPDFVSAADRYQLDWRLLPSIAIVETGCGRQQKRNNLFGWASARKGFESLRAGIYAVAERLANSKLYRNKELDALLRTYNRHAGYGKKVKRFMLVVESTEPLRARSTGEQRASALIELPPASEMAFLSTSNMDLASAPAPPAGWGAPPLHQPFR